MLRSPRPPLSGVSYTLLDYDEFISTCQAEEGWTIENIGPSSDPTKDMFGMLLGDPETQPVIYVVSSIHGNEWQAAYISQAFRRLLVSPPPGHKETFEMLRNTFAWYFVPVGNPYGIQLRKDLPEGDRFTGRYNANGVDVNRNFTAQSQPETQAIVSKFNDLKPVAFIDVHGIGYTRYLDIGVRDPDYRVLAQRIKEATHASIGGKGIQWYSPEIPGSTRAWATKQDSKHGGKCLAFLVEIEGEDAPEVTSYYGLNVMYFTALYIREWFRSGVLNPV